MNGGEPRTLDVPLTFLAPGRKFNASVYADDPAVTTRTHVRIDRLTVDSKTVLKCNLAAQGGQAMRLVPVP